MSKKSDQKGFTIIELLIATAVLSMILVMATLIITSIGNLYYKSINSARIQNDARTITEDVSQNLKLSNGTLTPLGPSPVYSAYCINTTSYTYVVGQQLGIGSSHVLWRDTVPSGTCKISDFTHGEEMVAAKSRLTKFDISPASPYVIDVGIAFGEDEALCNPDNPSTCAAGGSMTLADWKTAKCKGGIGDQFCATTTLSVTATRRITNN